MQPFQHPEKSLLHLEIILSLNLVFAVSYKIGFMVMLKTFYFHWETYTGFYCWFEDARSAQVPIKSRQSSSSNAIRQVSNGRDERKPVLKNGQMQPKAAPNKLNSTSKHALPSMDSRKQLGSNKANGPGRPMVGPKGLPSKITVANVEKRASSTQGVKDSMRGVHRVVSQSSVPKQPLSQKKEYQNQESKNGKLMPKPTVSASRPQVWLYWYNQINSHFLVHSLFFSMKSLPLFSFPLCMELSGK